jgi:hypothetical protein
MHISQYIDVPLNGSYNVEVSNLLFFGHSNEDFFVHFSYFDRLCTGLSYDFHLLVSVSKICEDQEPNI